MSKLTEYNINTLTKGALASRESLNRPKDKDSYADYCKKLALARPSHQDGDSAVIGLRAGIDCPYWVNVVINTSPAWTWAKANHSGMDKFCKMFPEFKDDPSDKPKQKKRAEWQLARRKKWSSKEKAEKYLLEGYNRWQGKG